MNNPITTNSSISSQHAVDQTQTTSLLSSEEPATEMAPPPLSHRLAQSLLREYMATHQHRNILRRFDQENPRNEFSITKRSQISELLQLDPADAAGMESILERLVSERLKRIKRKKRREKKAAKEKKSSGDQLDSNAGKTNSSDARVSKKSSKSRKKKRHHSEEEKQPSSAKDLGSSSQQKQNPSPPISDAPPSATKQDLLQKSRPQMGITEEQNRKPLFGSSSTKPNTSNRTAFSSKSLLSNDSTFGSSSRRNKPQSASSLSSNDDGMDLMLEDVDDSGLIMEDVGTSQTSTRTSSHHTMKPKQIGHSLGQKIRRLIIGETKMFDRSWLEQGFGFVTERPELCYGIVQHEGGSCGVIAAVQAHVLKELLTSKGSLPGSLNARDYSDALVEALTSILYNINHDSQVVCIGKRSTDHANPDISFGNFTYYNCSSREETRSCISRHISSFASPRGLGVLQLMTSAILTRGIENLQKDMDMSSNTMIVEYGYCSQELVNLLLVGRATSNVFDGMKMIGSRGDKTYLKGIQERSEIGFLTLMESYNYLEVGRNYKEAENNVWVIFSESHYSILFAKDNQPVGNRFVLYYWDGLANQDEEIALTITRTGQDQTSDITPDSFVPPLNRCIWTLFPDAKIDWSCDPLY